MCQAISQEEATNLIQNTLNNGYAEENFRKFAYTLLPSAERLDTEAICGDYIPQNFREYITSYKRLAKIRSTEKNIDVLAVKIKKVGSMVNARSMQRRFIASYLNGRFGGTLKDAAIVAFYVDEEKDSDWRLSLVYKNYVLEDDRVQETFSEPKRASFLVGKNEFTHTAEAQLVALLQRQDRESVVALCDAFNVEKISKEFFNEYKSLFVILEKKLEIYCKSENAVKAEFERCGIKPSAYANRFLSQIVFLYFLQKKGWLGVGKNEKWGTGSHSFLKDLFQRSPEKNFFADILNPLFYQALATDRSQADHWFEPLQCRVPFLNGGLFEPLAGHDWQKTPIVIENSFFDTLFATFDRFNFTVREDEPLESEVAIDPEMLGQVFETLLSERHATGTFYTPRKIVHYMCRESLIYYLDRTLNPLSEIPFEDIKTFIHHDEMQKIVKNRTQNKKDSEEYSPDQNADLPESIKNAAKNIDTALAQVKICDPAIGSGAFAVGMMYEIVQARLRLQHSSPDLFLTNGVLPTSYELKRNTIANSLYGVDIDASAVDIAKLRLWLSLVVDEDDFEQIRPLPNLDYKIMVGNSPTSWREQDSLIDFDNIKKMEQLRTTFFSITNHDEKARLKQEIAEIRLQCTTLGSFDWRVDCSEVFSTKELGFDIVIGNPPYIQIQNLSRNDPIRNLANKYQVFSGTGDVYCLFYELGYKLLTPNGILAFITSNKWMRSGYGESLRDFFLTDTKPLLLIDFAGNQVFEAATVDVNILLFEKTHENEIFVNTCSIEDKNWENLSEYFDQKNVASCFKLGQTWAVLTKERQHIKEKIEQFGIPLEKWDIKINIGINTGYNEAFVINGAKKDELIAKDPKSKEIIKPFLRGKDIKKYVYKLVDLWLINTHNGIKEKKIPPVDVNKYPAVKGHLDQFYEKLFKRSDQGDTPYNLRNCAYLEKFSTEKIIYSSMTKFLPFYLDTHSFFTNQKCFILTGEHLGYLCAFFNSKLFKYCFIDNFPTLQGGTRELSKIFFDKIPVHQVSDEENEKYTKLVYTIQKDREKGIDTSEKEQEIEHMLFDLYKLTPEERQVVEEFPYAEPKK